MNMHRNRIARGVYDDSSETMARANTNSLGSRAEPELRLNILVLPGFSQLSLSCFLEPLYHANNSAGRELFSWRIVSCAGATTVSASGVPVSVDVEIDANSDNYKTDAFVIIGGERAEASRSEPIYSLVRALQRRRIPIYAIGTATWLLAEAGILRAGTRCTIHWRRLAALTESFPDLIAEDCLFISDGSITTCAGEFAAFDLAVKIVQSVGGQELARSVCGQLTADRFRSGNNCQSMPLGLRYTGMAEKLIRVMKHMERCIEEPPCLDDMARAVSLSRRQIERLFRKHLQVSPIQYYSRLRLERARQLLETTNMPVIEVAVACGFISASHFSKSFKDHFGVLPSRARQCGSACGIRSPASRSA
ncbi:MAG: GlxA family transcriptional regulator [Mesorhizobium sp.]|nr:MAG: GlxA family transcriptional regulator [Mesorhizobium sp.]